MSVVAEIVRFSSRFAHAVVVLCVAAAIFAGTYTASNFDMNTDSAALISPDIGWRKREARYDAAFPQRVNLIAVVIDGATPELADRGAELLAEKLGAHKDVFSRVQRPDGGDFFARNGLLFLPLADVQATMNQLIAAQGMLAPLSADPSLRGVMGALSMQGNAVAQGYATIDQIEKPIAALDVTLGKIVRGENAFFSWQSLVAGPAAALAGSRRFIETQAKLDFGALEAGKTATDTIRQTARDLKLTPEHGVKVRLTGPVPLADEEFATISDRAVLMGVMMSTLVLLTLWFALKSFRIIGSILVTLFAGLAITMGAGLFFVGVFNIISIAFVALFVGLGVDFAIQFAVRYRAERFLNGELHKSLVEAGRGVGIPLALAAAATAAGFFSFLPTDYVGVAELGLVAGIGMVVAFVLCITLLPALLRLVKPAGEGAEIGYSFLGPLDEFLSRHRKTVLSVTAGFAVFSLALIPNLEFNFNPLDLRSRKVESVATITDLAANPQTSPNTIDAIASSPETAEALAKKISALPDVGQTITLKSFVPQDQDAKLVIIRDAATLLDTTIEPFMTAPPPSDAENIAGLKSASAALRAAGAKVGSSKSGALLGLAATLDKLAAGPASLRARATDALIPGLQVTLKSLAQSMRAEKVTLKSLPPELVRNWKTADGRTRVEIFPAQTGSDAVMLKRFSDAVRTLVPEATGAPISIQESGNTILNAFLWAGIWSFLAITILLFLVLRRARDVALTLIPLALSGIFTLATCVAIGLQLNFANVIALPLLFGIGVAFSIYFVVAWRAGASNLLQSSLTRAIVFSALTTATGFGTLWLSSHPGTASMGELLMISLGWTLVMTLFVLPVLMGPPPQHPSKSGW